MGSGSSSSKTAIKTESPKPKSKDDINALTRLKKQTKALETIREDVDGLQDYINAASDRHKANKGSGPGSHAPEGNKRQLVTDVVEKLVEDIIVYVDKINITFDDLQGSLGLFYDAIVKRIEQSKSDVQQASSKETIQDILAALDETVNSAKERLSVVKQQNVTPQILQSIEAELREYSSMKDDLERHFKVLQGKRTTLLNELKDSGVGGKTIDEILRWKEDVLKLDRTYGHITAANDQTSAELRTRIKELKDSNDALLSELDTLHHQCEDSDKNALDAKDSVQRVEEKILEERLSHEVEINALKALLEKKNRLIKQLGGSDTDIPLSPQPDQNKSKQLESQMQSSVNNKSGPSLIKHSSSDSEDDNESSLAGTTKVKKKSSKLNENAFVIGKELEHDGNEITATNTSVGVLRIDKRQNTLNNSQDPGFNSTVPDRHQMLEAQVPEDSVVYKTKKDDLTYNPNSTTLISTAVQVSEKDLMEDVNTKLDEKEDTSSDLGLSVKSEFIQNTPDLLDDGNDSGQDVTSDRNRADINTNTPFGGKKSPHERQKKDSIVHNAGDFNTGERPTVNGMASQSNSPHTEKDEDPLPMEEAIPESFADMIQLVSKDDCITTLETTEEDVHIYEGTTKEIIYKRNDGGIDWDVAYHRGIGAVVRTTREDFGIDTVRVDIIDEVETTMLPDLVLGERPISFHLHIREKDGSNLVLQEDDVKVFVPHRPLKEYEDVSLIYSVNGADWEDCDLVDELPASVDSETVDIVGTVLPTIRDVKLVAIARERMVDLIAGEGDVSYVSSFDESIRVNISKDTFRSHTIAKLLVHHSHILGLQSAINMHEECRSISSCTAFICIVCASVTRNHILVDMDIPYTGEHDAEECRYTMFCLNESGWKLADCTWDLTNRRLTINLMPGSRSYRLIGIDVPMSIHMEERLAAVKTIHEHTSHYQVCVFVRQRQDDPKQAVVMCLRTHLTELALSELSHKGFSMGSLISQPICIMDGDVLSIEVTGGITAKPVNSEKMTMTFYPQREMSTKLLLLLPVKSDDQSESSTGAQSESSTGTISIIKHETDENVDVLSGSLSLSPNI